MIDDFLKLLYGSIVPGKSVFREEVSGFIVSTIFAYDLEVYETAIIDQNGTHPVERYKEESDSVEGHEKWKKMAESLDGKKVTKLGYGTSIEDSEIVLQAMSTWTKHEQV